MAHLTEAAYPTKLCLDFYSGNTVYLEMKDISRRHINSRDFSNSHFPPSFSCASDFLASYETSACKRTSTIPSLDQSVLIYNLLEGSGLAKVGPDNMSFFNLPCNL